MCERETDRQISLGSVPPDTSHVRQTEECIVIIEHFVYNAFWSFSTLPYSAILSCRTPFYSRVFTPWDPLTLIMRDAHMNRVGGY